MIGDVLENITKELSSFIDAQAGFSTGKKTVILAKPSNAKGEISLPDNCIAMSLINIKEDASNRSPLIKKRVEGDKVYTQAPGISLDLSVIFIANFPNDYVSELNYITKVIEFFQEKDTFSIENTPSLKKQNRYFENLVFRLGTTKLEEQHHIWNQLGIKYMPSVIYNVGKILIQEDEILSETKVARRVATKLVNK